VGLSAIIAGFERGFSTAIACRPIDLRTGVESRRFGPELTGATVAVLPCRLHTVEREIRQSGVAVTEASREVQLSQARSSNDTEACACQKMGIGETRAGSKRDPLISSMGPSPAPPYPCCPVR